MFRLCGHKKRRTGAGATLFMMYEYINSIIEETFLSRNAQLLRRVDVARSRCVTSAVKPFAE